MGAEVIILANPYTYNFLKGLTHSAMVSCKDFGAYSYTAVHSDLSIQAHDGFL